MKTHQRQLILDYGKFLKVEQHTVELDNGHVIPDWTWVITPDFVNVVLITPDDRFVLFRQSKYAIEGDSLAPVGGYIEPGEDPLEAAKREAFEETGYQSDEWYALGTFIVDANRGCGQAHFFLAKNAYVAGEPHADDLEPQEIVLLTRQQVQQSLQEFKVLPWVAVMTLVLLHDSAAGLP